MNFKLKHISETYSDPVSSICDIGKFDGTETTYADLVFVRDGIDGVRTYMNSTVLRCALLSNPELLAMSTGLACVNVEDYNNLVERCKQLLKKVEELEKELSKSKTRSRLDVRGVE